MRRVLFAVILCAVACEDPVPPPPPPPPGTPTLQPLGTFASPVFVTSPPGDTARLFVVEQAGRIRVFRHDTLLGPAFLDLRGRITVSDEEGLLSVAFHPQYATNGRFYVYFTRGGNLRIVRYNVSTADPNVADEATADTVIAIAHPTNANHNGGQLQFGLDGKLYAATGDGGGANDVPGNAQNRHSLLGKVLRLDVDGATGFAIPTDNPFATDTTAEPQIWALGLRNPWRFSFDRQTGDLYIGDVGQGAFEEVNVSSSSGGGGKGLNYGWRTMEGMHCFPIGTPTCSTTGLTAPLIEYANDAATCAVTGGYVYRGARVSQLFGHYLYADFCAGFVRSFRFQGSAPIDQTDWTEELSPGANISSFGQDAEGDVYIMSLSGGLYRIIVSP